MKRQHYLIVFMARNVGSAEWVSYNEAISCSPAAWLADTLDEYGDRQETVLTFALPISAADFKKLNERL